MNERFAAGFDPITSLMTSWARFNQVMVGQLEKWVVLRMDSLKSYVDLYLAQVKIAPKVTDPRSLHEFLDSQIAVLSFVSHRMVDDGRTMAEWGVDCCGQANRLARENMLRALFKY